MTRKSIIRTALTAIVFAVFAACSGNSEPLSPVTESTPADFGGHYSGTFRVNKCVADGVFLGSCEEDGFTVGTTVPMELSLDQNLATVTGTVLLGGLDGTFQGIVTGNTLGGSAVMTDLSDEAVAIKAGITGWNTTISENALSGGFTVIFRVISPAGAVTITAGIVQLTRSSS